MNNRIVAILLSVIAFFSCLAHTEKGYLEMLLNDEDDINAFASFCYFEEGTFSTSSIYYRRCAESYFAKACKGTYNYVNLRHGVLVAGTMKYWSTFGVLFLVVVVPIIVGAWCCRLCCCRGDPEGKGIDDPEFRITGATV